MQINKPTKELVRQKLFIMGIPQAPYPCHVCPWQAPRFGEHPCEDKGIDDICLEFQKEYKTEKIKKAHNVY